MHFRSFLSTERYDALPESDHESDTPMKKVATRSKRVRDIPFFFALSHAFAGLVGISLGLFVGNWIASSDGRAWDGYPKPPGHSTVIWHPNHTFSGPATPSGEKAWSELMPRGRGFILNKHLAPGTRSVAAFHEIHCLHALKLAYDSRVNDINKLQKLTHVNHYLDTIGANTTYGHVEHCFEYLRYALMCFADSNLEVLAADGDASAWGDERVCRSFDGLVAWSEKWRVSKDDSLLD